MNKYDYGYELADNSTNSWAFNRIPDSAVVLELGPSNGNLIYHLTTQKNCVADIVELDEEAGREAARYARTACIGMEEGNLELGFWYQKLQGKRYDYIIMLDVLEHIRNPKEVLRLLTSLLKKEGKILLSVPNIAHNSVLINLLQNKLEYTSVGLLDETHVHFYTYSSILQLLKEAKLEVSQSEVKQVAVNNNEIEAVYGFLPREVEAYLKTREHGTAYQFLLTVSQMTAKTAENPLLLYKKDTLYKVAVFNESSALVLEQPVNPLDPIALEIPIDINCTKIRIDPLDTNCIISDVRLVGITQNNQNVVLPITETTGNQFDDKYVFYDDDPQLYVNVSPKIKTVIFSCKIDVFDSNALALLIPFRDLFRQTTLDYIQVRELYENAEKSIQDLNSSLKKESDIKLELQTEHTQLKEWNRKADEELKQTDNTISELKKEVMTANNTIAGLQKTLKEKNENIILLQEKLKKYIDKTNELQNELDNITNTIWGKIYYKLYK